MKKIKRLVCKKRARKLRKLGEMVFWDQIRRSWAWMMYPNLYWYQRQAIRTLNPIHGRTIPHSFSAIDIKPGMGKAGRMIVKPNEELINAKRLVIDEGFIVKGTLTGRLPRDSVPMHDDGFDACMHDPDLSFLKRRRNEYVPGSLVVNSDFTQLEKRVADSLKPNEEDSEDV